MADLFSFNLCRECEETSLNISCDSQKITIQKLDANSNLIKEMIYIRAGSFLQEDVEHGIISLMTNLPLLDGNSIIAKGQAKVVFYTDPGTEVISNGCSSFTASDTYTETLNRLKYCLESCCGGLATVDADIVEAGTLNTPLAATAVAAGDGCPDDATGTPLAITYGLSPGTEEGGTAVVAAAGTYTFTPATPTTALGRFRVQIFCDGTPVHSKLITINFS